MSIKKKVFVSGCFDLLHAGHIAFLQEASHLGDLFVGIGSDKTITALKNRRPINSEDERLYLLRSVKYVKDAWINSGSGMIDFAHDLLEKEIQVLFVNEDGDSEEKRSYCNKYGIEYIVGKRLPFPGLQQKSTTQLIYGSHFPYRIDLAGGWLDQPFVSEYHCGPVITISIEPTNIFNERSGMATSTRNAAIQLWGNTVPLPSERNAEILFRYDNPPGKKEISGSQDALGILLPGINYLHYNGSYWPDEIRRCNDPCILNWLQDHLFLIPLSSRTAQFDVLADIRASKEKVERLSRAANECWAAVMNKNITAFGKTIIDSFEAQVAIFPNMITSEITGTIEQIKGRILGYKIAGAGGGGYLVCIGDQKSVADGMSIKIRS